MRGMHVHASKVQERYTHDAVLGDKNTWEAFFGLKMSSSAA
jgi:hypothetical protein